MGEEPLDDQQQGGQRHEAGDPKRRSYVDDGDKLLQ